MSADWSAVWVSVASFVIAVFALWRTGRVRVLDRRTELLRDLADLRPRLKELERSIPPAVQARVSASSAIGLGSSGNMAVFRECAKEDTATVGNLIIQLEALAHIRWLPTYAHIEGKMVAARELRTRWEQISEKYAAAAREDAATRKHEQDHMTALTAARLTKPPDMNR